MNLPTDFFVQHPIDFEHKNYLLLAYLQGVEADFAGRKIYPGLSSVITHIRTMRSYREQQQNISERIRQVKKFDWNTMQLEYEDAPDTNEMQEVNRIVDHSLEQLNGYYIRGSELFEDVSANLHWKIVGIMPQYVDEGFLILHIRPKKFQSYRYRIDKIQLSNENFFGISMELKDETESRFLTYADLKQHLVKLNPDLPVPMTIAVETEDYPLKETLLPVIKTQALLKIKPSGRPS